MISAQSRFHSRKAWNVLAISLPAGYRFVPHPHGGKRFHRRYCPLTYTFSRLVLDFLSADFPDNIVHNLPTTSFRNDCDDATRRYGNAYAVCIYTILTLKPAFFNAINVGPPIMTVTFKCTKQSTTNQLPTPIGS